jgi:hypothetical protein
MVDFIPQFEISDLAGTVTHFSGVATTVAVQIPAVPSTVIAEVLIRNTNDFGSDKLQVSFDGGVSYFDIDTKDALACGPKGQITSIHIRSSSGSVNYQVIMNREPLE